MARGARALSRVSSEAALVMRRSSISLRREMILWRYSGSRRQERIVMGLTPRAWAMAGKLSPMASCVAALSCCGVSPPILTISVVGRGPGKLGGLGGFPFTALRLSRYILGAKLSLPPMSSTFFHECQEKFLTGQKKYAMSVRAVSKYRSLSCSFSFPAAPCRNPGRQATCLLAWSPPKRSPCGRSAAGAFVFGAGV